MSLVNFQDVCRNHIGRMRPKHVWILMNGPSIVVPLLLIHKGTHVIANTQDFLHSQLQILGEQHDGFVTVTLEKQVWVIFPFAFVNKRDRTRILSR